jgi:periodic tryptophan protein 1
MTAEIEKNLEGLALDKYDQEESDLVFTSELEMLKPKNERDSEMANAAEDDEDIEEGSSESVDSFGDGETGGQRNRNRDKFPEALEDSEEEKEDYTIRKTDSLIVAATAEDEHSNLEVYVYDHKSSDLYVHHEIILSSYPLCIEWLNNFRGQSVNYVIVGSFLP